MARNARSAGLQPETPGRGGSIPCLLRQHAGDEVALELPEPVLERRELLIEVDRRSERSAQFLRQVLQADLLRISAPVRLHLRLLLLPGSRLTFTATVLGH